jgi:hypothetical protein
VVAVEQVQWGEARLRIGRWCMVDPTLQQPFVPRQQAANPEQLPGVMTPPSMLWFVRITRVLVVAHGLADPAGNARHGVLEVAWHRSPPCAPYSLEIQAPLIAANDEVRPGGNPASSPPSHFIPVGWVLPLGFTVRPFEPADTCIALRRTWQPLSAVGAQPPWPQMQLYDFC